jgi:nitrate/nitrite transport system ATP-binding protein
MTAILELSGIAKSRGDHPVLADIDLAVTEGELIAIVGFSGAGKSTLVSLMAGLDLPDRGTVSVRGVPVTGPGPDRGVVFQTYALMPWLSARANVALAVDATAGDLDRAGRAARTESYLAMVGLSMPATVCPANCRAGCASGWPWPGRWPCGRTSCCWTSRSRRWTP